MNELPSRLPAFLAADPDLALPRLRLAPLRPAVRRDAETLLPVLVTVEAPKAKRTPITGRPPLAVSLVVDRSASMRGLPLQEARACARHVVSGLQPSDVMSIVQFDGRADVLCPAAPVGDGRLQLEAIERIEVGENTNLYDGWHTGAMSLGSLEGFSLRRVMLLSDGHANEGPMEAERLIEAGEQWAARGVTTSTYGLGHRFNEELLTLLARGGGGNAYYGDEAEDLHDCFRCELDLINHLSIRRLRMRLVPGPGTTLQVERRQRLSPHLWELPDVGADAQSWALLHLRVSPASGVAERRPGDFRQLLAVAVSGELPDGSTVALKPRFLALPTVDDRVWARLRDHPGVKTRMEELEAASLLDVIGSAAARDDWAAVDLMVHRASRRFDSHNTISAALRAIGEMRVSDSRLRARKELTYTAESLGRRLLSLPDGDGGRDDDAEPMYTRLRVPRSRLRQPN